ncbi:unnamed protein product [Discula destructiva]
MSFSLLRVPKKAALTVWSGLAVGTSCTLVLIVEDRRRRIDQARSAVHNARKLRSSKQYHASALLLDESAAATKRFDQVFTAVQPVVTSSSVSPRKIDEHQHLTDLTPASPRYQEDPDHNAADQQLETVLTYPGAERTRRDSFHDWRGKPTDTELEKDHPRTVDTEEIEPTVSQTRPSPGVRPWKVHPSIRASEMPESRVRTVPSRRRSPRTMFPPLQRNQDIDVDGNIQRITRAANFGDEASLDQAVEILRQSLRKLGLTAESKRSLAQAATKLCLKCRQAGMMDQAMRALHSAIELGPMAEADYFATNPQPVIDYAVSVAESKIAIVKEKGWKISYTDRLLLRKRMDRTILLLMPQLLEGTLSASHVPEWVPVAAKCMHLALDLENMQDKADEIFERIKYYGGDPDGLILLGYLQRLHEQQLYRRIVNTFNLNRHRLVDLDIETWRALGDIVTDAVDNGPGQNAAKVLKHMIEFCPAEHCLPQLPLRTTWATKLLYCHWNRMGSFEETLALLQQFEDLGGFDLIVYKDGMYRTMIQIAVEAQQWQELDKLLQKLLLVKPSAAKEARILGLLALAKAQLGDWNAVWDDFKRMEIKDRIEDAFSPILHEFIKTHTTRETEDFLKAYIQEIRVPISPQMVNMVANRYGDIRDYESFLNWLSWCSNQGFEVDAAFGNAIIHNCRRRWDCSYEDLQRIYRTLQALSPKFVDNVTENTLVSASLRTHKKAKIPFLKKQVGFANRKFHRWTITESASDMRLDMRHAFSTRDYRKVLSLYRLASSKLNVPLDEGHLRLAVQASLKLEDRPQPAFKMIREAKERGMDVSHAVTLLFIRQLRSIFSGDTSDKDHVMQQVQSCIARFEASELSIGHQAQLRVAHQLLGARHFAGAISFGLSALQSKGITHPDDITTFQLFVVAYGYRADVQGLKWTLAGAVHMQYYHKRAVYMALKDARNHLSKQIQSTDVKQAQSVVTKGLDMVRQRRLEVMEDRKHIERHTLDIMARAALEAEHQPTCEEAIKKRNAMVAELQQRARLEEAEQARKAEERRAVMQARREAAEEAARLNQEEADAMEAMLAANKHEISGDF